MSFKSWLSSLIQPRRRPIRTATPRTTWPKRSAHSRRTAFQRKIPRLVLESLEDRTTPTVSFLSGVDYPLPAAGSAPTAITVADFNGDGVADLATANLFTNSVSVLLNTGTGTFHGAVTYPAGSYPTDIVAADFNGDGSADLATAEQDGFSVMFNNGTGAFASPVLVSSPGRHQGIAAADFNGDGKTDLATTDLDQNTITVYLNDGADYSFPSRFSQPAGTNPVGIQVGDFNNDGLADIANTNQDTVSVSLNAGGGSFGLAVVYPLNTTWVGGLTVGDFNGDGQLDLATANYIAGSISVLLNDGTGHFSAPLDSSVGYLPGNVAPTDFNHDGRLDLAIANYSWHNLTIALNDGAGHFIVDATLDVEGNANAVAVADFNDDGFADIASLDSAAYADPARISIFLQAAVLHISGTEGDDTIVLSTRAGHLLRNGVDTGIAMANIDEIHVWGLGGNDTIDVRALNLNTFIDGGAGNDVLTGGVADDVIIGGDGNDTITGGAGNDVLIGAAGNDRIVGCAGNDILVAGNLKSDLTLAMLRAISSAWNQSQNVTTDMVDDFLDEVEADIDSDKLTGSAGADLFLIDTRDSITDYLFGKPNTNKDGDVVVRDGIVAS